MTPIVNWIYTLVVCEALPTIRPPPPTCISVYLGVRYIWTTNGIPAGFSLKRGDIRSDDVNVYLSKATGYVHILTPEALLLLNNHGNSTTLCNSTQQGQVQLCAASLTDPEDCFCPVQYTYTASWQNRATRVVT